MKPRRPRGPSRKASVVAVHPHFPPGKAPAANCECQDADSSARFTVTINGHTLCSWCGGEM